MTPSSTSASTSASTSVSARPSSVPGILRLRHTGRPRGGSRIVLAVITDSLEDVAVARVAAELATSSGGRLVLATPLPTDGVLVEAGLPGLPLEESIPADARASVGRVRPALDAYGVSYSVLPVPYRDRGGPRRRSRHISTALLITAQMLRARRLVLGEYACWQPNAPRVAARLAAAARTNGTGGIAVTVVPAGSSPARPRLTTLTS